MTTAKLKGPDNHGGFSHQGVSYEPDATGHIDVPHEALNEAFSHGFALAMEQQDDDQDAEAKAAKKSGRKTA